MQINKGNYGIGVKAAVLLLMIGHYANSLMSPITGVLYAEFPDQLSLVKMVSTINYLAGSIPLIFMAPLSRRFTTKQLSLTGLILILFGIIPAFAYGLEILMASQFVCGLGVGIMYAFAASYIVNLWDGAEADRMMGNRSTVGAIMGVLYQQFAGRAATASGSYQPAFLCLFGVAIVFIICLINLPKTYPIEIADRAARISAEQSHDPKVRKIYPMTWALCILACVILNFAQAMMVNMSIVSMADPALGGLGVEASTVSNIMMCFSISMILSGQIYARLWVKLFKSYTVAAGVFMLVVGMGILCAAHSISFMIVGVVIYGCGFQCFNASILQLVPKTTIPTGAAFSISVFWIFSNIGSFLSSIVTPAIATAVFGDALRRDWYVAIIGLLICAIIELFFCRRIRRAQQPVQYQ